MEIEALAWRLLERIGALHRQGKLSKEATLALNDPATELRRALAHAAINEGLLGVRVDVREETADEEWSEQDTADADAALQRIADATRHVGE